MSIATPSYEAGEILILTPSLTPLRVQVAVPCHTCDEVLAAAISSIPGLTRLGAKLLLSIVGREIERTLAEEALSVAARTTFKEHAIRHATEAGVDSVSVERAVILDMTENAAPKRGFLQAHCRS